MTAFDPPMLPPPSELALRMKMERAAEILEDTESDFYYEAQDVLGKAAKNMPLGSTAGGVAHQACGDTKGERVGGWSEGVEQYFKSHTGMNKRSLQVCTLSRAWMNCQVFDAL